MAKVFKTELSKCVSDSYSRLALWVILSQLLQRGRHDSLRVSSGWTTFGIYSFRWRTKSVRLHICHLGLVGNTLAKEQRGCGFKPRYRQIHGALDDHLKWMSSVMGSSPQWQAKEP